MGVTGQFQKIKRERETRQTNRMREKTGERCVLGRKWNRSEKRHGGGEENYGLLCCLYMPIPPIAFTLKACFIGKTLDPQPSQQERVTNQL